MKPSYFQTPRNLADCTFEVGYYSPTPKRQQTDTLGVIGSAVGAAALFGIALMLLLAYFDVLVK
jgi:hypothetical protein